jgi:hypothetical protein
MHCTTSTVRLDFAQPRDSYLSKSIHRDLGHRGQVFPDALFRADSTHKNDGAYNGSRACARCAPQPVGGWPAARHGLYHASLPERGFHSRSNAP